MSSYAKVLLCAAVFLLLIIFITRYTSEPISPEQTRTSKWGMETRHKKKNMLTVYDTVENSFPALNTPLETEYYYFLFLLTHFVAV